MYRVEATARRSVRFSPGGLYPTWPPLTKGREQQAVERLYPLRPFPHWSLMQKYSERCSIFIPWCAGGKPA